MGTTYKVLIAEKLPASLNQAYLFKLLNEVDQEMSTYIPSSSLNKLNSYSVDNWLKVSSDLIKILNYSQQLCLKSGGAFNVAVGNLVNSWGFGPSYLKNLNKTNNGISYQEISCNSIDIDLSTNSVRKIDDVFLDLSAIAKGFAVDLVANHLLKLGVNNFLIEVGGEIRASGEKSNEPWNVGIENPFDSKKPFLVIKTKQFNNFAMATSGNYKNFQIINNERITHTFDPRTGKSINSNVLSVSVINKDAMVADALATTLLVLGLKEGLEFSEENQLQAIFIFSDKNKLRYKTSSNYSKRLE